MNSLFHPFIKLKPDVMNHLSSHFGTVQSDDIWCRRFDRNCRLFTWSICISWNYYQFVSVSLCCFVAVYCCFAGILFLLRQNFPSIFKIPRVFPEFSRINKFPEISRFSRVKHPVISGQQLNSKKMR